MENCPSYIKRTNVTSIWQVSAALWYDTSKNTEKSKKKRKGMNTVRPGCAFFANEIDFFPVPNSWHWQWVQCELCTRLLLVGPHPELRRNNVLVEVQYNGLRLPIQKEQVLKSSDRMFRLIRKVIWSCEGCKVPPITTLLLEKVQCFTFQFLITCLAFPYKYICYNSTEITHEMKHHTMDDLLFALMLSRIIILLSSASC